MSETYLVGCECRACERARANNGTPVGTDAARIATLEADLARMTGERDELIARVTTVSDEAFGPFPVQSASESLSVIERGIFEQRRDLERERKEHAATGKALGTEQHRRVEAGRDLEEARRLLEEAMAPGVDHSWSYRAASFLSRLKSTPAEPGKP
jgi:hypothetical protein